MERTQCPLMRPCSHRLTLDKILGPLSAGLSPRVFFSSSAPNDKKFDLVTFTTPGYLMGGAYFWQQAGVNRHPETGSPVPYFQEGVPIPFKTLYPYHGRPDLAIDYSPGRFVIYQRKGKGVPDFQENEELSERFGIGLFDQQVGSIPCAKLEIRDFIGDGLRDVIIGENNWGGNCHESGKNGKKCQKKWTIIDLNIILIPLFLDENSFELN